MAEKVLVRDARRSDEDALRRIRHEAWSPAGSPGDQPPRDRPFLEALDRDETVLVAVLGGELAGYAQFGTPTPNRSNRHVRQLNGIDVDPAFRRRGVATALLDAVARKAEYAGAKRLTLRVFSTNTGAIAMYESFGFEPEGVLRGEFEIDGQLVDDQLMALPLPRPRSSHPPADDD
ncbi:GNAT family N-acetyltransferase [Thermoleophilia bacterium SCSIO 60948]|nr:GNAT family N-acetyltransferase [Thermoleophilia bacterium SCSIO 60948]